MKKYLILFFLTYSLNFLSSVNKDNLQIEINTPHTNKIFAMDVLESENLLFTGSDDGSIRLWNNETRKVLLKLQISHLQIKKIAVNPILPIIALIETDGISNYFLSVWNYKEGKKLYSKKIQEIPLSMKFSPKGTWLIYSLTKWNSLFFLESFSGENVNSINISSEIIYDFLLSSSEKTILLYKSSGQLDYINTKNGKIKKSFKTKSNLRNTSFNKDNVIMAASKNKKLFIVDLLKGSSTNTNINCDKIYFVKFFKSFNKILCISEKNSKFEASIFAIKNSKLLLEKRIPIKTNGSINSLTLTNNFIFYSDNTNNISYYNINNTITGNFSKHDILNILNLSFNENFMIAVTNNKVLNFKSDFFGKTKTETPKYFNADFKKHPDETIKGMTHLNEEEFITWNNSGEIKTYNPITNTILKNYKINNNFITNIIPHEDTILVQDKNGKCLIYKNSENEILFEYNYPGLITSTLTKNKNIIAGTTINSNFKTPLVFINSKTGETLALKDDNLLTYNIEYNDKKETIYTMGLETRKDKIISVIKSHSGKNFDLNKTLYSYKGEDNTASILLDKKKERLYTTMGYDSVKLVSYDGITPFNKGKHIPRKLYEHNNYLYALNKDKSITIWDKSNGKIVMDFYIFEDLNWVAILADNKFYSSENPEKYLSIRSDIFVHPDKLLDFKLN